MYGDGKDPAATKITAKLDASVTGAAYAARYGAHFAKAAPGAQAMYATIKDRAVIGTFGTATVWGEAPAGTVSAIVLLRETDGTIVWQAAPAITTNGTVCPARRVSTAR